MLPDVDPVIPLLHQGLALQKDGKLPAAERVYRQALDLVPGHPLTLHLLGTVVGQTGRWFEAIELLQSSLRIQPADPKAWNNLAVALLDAGDSTKALEAAERALALAPDYYAARLSWANACFGLKRFAEAVAAFRGLICHTSAPQRLAFFGLWRSAAAVCDWDAMGEAALGLNEVLSSGDMVLRPFDALAYADDPQLHCRSAAAEVARVMEREGVSPYAWERSARPALQRRIRLAYVSADFHEHATAYLMAELFERHDRSRFEVIAVSFGPDDRSPMRKRLKAAFDQFWDVSQDNATAISQRMRDEGVDIAIDLKGFTRDSRPSIFLRKPAPVVVSYLGYPGTMGSTAYDYVVGDPVVTPAELAPNYVEKVVQMPATYQVNDTQRVIAAQVPSRVDEGLPERGFVFAAFNNVYKITPAFFAAWMRLLAAVHGSVLWLVCSDTDAQSHLRSSAQSHGIDSQRLVFARRAPLAQHLARHAHADLLLDNLPYNAHTTTSDALWAGVPVVTCMGQAFAGRVAASLLNAVGLPELVTHSLPEYEAQALRLATNPHELQRMRAHLKAVRSSTPLFDTERFTRDLESAYVHMHERRLQGLPPEGFAVPEVLGAGMQPLRSVPPSLQTSP